MTRAGEGRGGGGMHVGDSNIVPSSTSSLISSPSQQFGKSNNTFSSITTSPQKKASPSDIIFGKPPGANGSLYSDSSSSPSRENRVAIDIQQTKPASAIAVASEGSASGSASSSAYSDPQRHSPSSRPATSATSARSQSIVDVGTAMDQDVKVLPDLFEDADADDIVELVADMLTRLTTHNDQLPLHPTSLTRFHSRATPSISVLSYLKRITKYTSLEKACTLILLVYIDRVCERVSGFTICSLTVHRFICAAVVCASKALCDSFSTNGHYARVGGISLIELNLLEKEFLQFIDWQLMPGTMLQNYYSSLKKEKEARQG